MSQSDFSRKVNGHTTRGRHIPPPSQKKTPDTDREKQDTFTDFPGKYTVADK